MRSHKQSPPVSKGANVRGLERAEGACESMMGARLNLRAPLLSPPLSLSLRFL